MWFFQMLRIVVVAISFILICTGTELLVIYVTIYNGFYKGFGRYLSLSSFLVDGQANCTDFDPSLHTGTTDRSSHGIKVEINP